MKTMHATHATGAEGALTESGMVALVRGRIKRIGLALARASRPARGAGMSLGSARRTDLPPFADTEASWHPL